MNILLTRIKKKDIELLRKWRMKPEITKYMFTDPHISVDEQQKWYTEILTDSSRIDFSINVDERLIGHYYITNINGINKTCEVGFYIGDSDYCGKGIYTSVQIAIDRFVFNQLLLHEIKLYSFEENPNIKKYSFFGFKEDIDESYKIIKNGKVHFVKCFVLSKDRFKDIADFKNSVIIDYSRV